MADEEERRIEGDGLRTFKGFLSKNKKRPNRN